MNVIALNKELLDAINFVLLRNGNEPIKSDCIKFSVSIDFEAYPVVTQSTYVTKSKTTAFLDFLDRKIESD